MAIGISPATVLLKYKADTKQAQKEVKKLSGAQKKAAQESVAAMEKQNAKLDGQIEMWGKVAVGIGTAVVAYKALSESAKFYQERSRLMAANSSTDLDGLRKATQGLVADTDLLKFSAGLMSGEFAINQKQMEGALKGALALRKELGIELPEAMTRIKQSIQEVDAGALKPFGLVAKATTGTIESQKEALDFLADTYGRTGGNVKVAGDAITGANTELQNSTDSLKNAFGEMATQLTPVIVAMAKLVELGAAWIKGLNAIPDWLVPDATDVDRGLGQLHARLRSSGQALEQHDIKDATLDARIAAAKAKAQAAPGFGKGGGKGKGATVLAMGEDIIYIDPLAKDPAFLEVLKIAAQDRAKDAAALPDSGGPLVKVDFAGSTFSEAQKSAADATKKANAVPFENAKVAASNMALAASYDVLGQATGAAYEAIVNGSGLSLKATKKMIAGIIMAVGKESAIKAVFELAQGAASLYFAPPKAAAHFQAAALYGSVAVAAGVASAALGGTGGGSSPGAGAGTAPSARPNPKIIEGGNQSNIIVLGENWDDRSPRQRAQAAKNLMRRAEFEVRGDVVSRG